MDLLIGGANPAGKRFLNGDDIAYRHIVLFNNGQGVFTYDSANSRIDSTIVENAVTAMAVDDFNLDGCADFFATATNYVDQQHFNFFQNDCSGNFSVIHSTTDPLDLEWLYTPVFPEDVDGDNRRDYVLGAWTPGRNMLFENVNGSFLQRSVTWPEVYQLTPAGFLYARWTVQ